MAITFDLSSKQILAVDLSEKSVGAVFVADGVVLAANIWDDTLIWQDDEVFSDYA